MLKNLALWGFVTSAGQRIGITFWATHTRHVSEGFLGVDVSSASDHQLVAGVEAATRKKKSPKCSHKQLNNKELQINDVKLCK